MRVRVDEVLGEVGGVELRGVDGVLLGFDVDGVFDGVGGDDDAVVGFGVAGGCQWDARRLGGEGGILRSLDLTLEEAADGHLGDGLDAGFLVPVDLVDADIVLAVAGRGDGRHGCGEYGITRGNAQIRTDHWQ